MKRTRQHSASEPQTSTISTAGEVLDDGTLIELVRSAPGSARLLLLKSRKGEEPVIAPVHHLPTGVYVPAVLADSVLQHTNLPYGCASYVSARDLYCQLIEVFKTRCACETGEAQIAACFVCASYFADGLHAAPCLGITADEADGTIMLRALNCLCRHPLPLADLQSGGLWSLPRRFNPTLLLHETKFSSAAINALRASQHRGFGVLQREGIAAACCAKAFLIGADTPEDLLELSSVQIHLHATPGSAAVLDDSALREVADFFQPRLLQYRLDNFDAVRGSNFDVPGFVGPTRQAAHTFGACVMNDPELQAGVVALLKPQEQLDRARRWVRRESLIVEALLVLCHRNETTVRVGELATLVNVILEGRGENFRMTARRVGAVLRQLKLLAERDSRGYGFHLSNEVNRAIHQLGRTMEVPSLQELVPGCEFCAELAPDAGQR